MRKTLLYIGLMILWVLCSMVGEGRADVIVSEAEIHASVTAYARETLVGFEGEIDITVRRRGDLRIDGVGAVRLRVRPDRMRNHARSLPVVLEIVRGPAVVRESHMIADVRYFDDVVVAVRSIDRGEPIAQDAVTTERHEVTMLLGKYYSRIDQLDDMRAKMRIGMGRPLSTHYVEPTPVVERGDMVRIQAKVGGILATTLGIARDSGTKGERIVVQNAHSREKLLAEIVAPGKVRVVF